MNIGGNLNAMINSGDFSAASVGMTGSAKTEAGFSAESSAFRKMMAQNLANERAKTGYAAKAPTESETDDASTTADAGELNDVMAALLFGNQAQAKLKLMSQSESSNEVTLLSEAQDQDEAEGTMTDSLANALALFDGAFRVNLITTNDSAETTVSELSAETLASLLEAAQPGKSGISGLLNMRQGNGQTETKKGIQLIMQSVDSSGKMIVAAEIDGKQIEFSGQIKQTEMENYFLNTSQDATTLTDAANAAGSQGISLEELAALLKRDGYDGVLPGLGKLTAAQHNEEDVQDVSAPQLTMLEQAAANQTVQSSTQAIETTGSGQQQDTESADETMTISSLNDHMKASMLHAQMNTAGAADTAAATQTDQPSAAGAYSQVSGEILAALEKKGPSEFKMQLQPEDLGQIDISLKISQGKLIIDIMADKTQTQALLTGQVDKLISSLGLQNVQVESVQVSQQMNSDSQSSQHQAYQNQGGMNFSNDRQNSEEAQKSWQQFSGGRFSHQDDSVTDSTENLWQTGNSFSRMNYTI